MILRNMAITLLGAGGHGRVVAEIAELNGYDVAFVDAAWPKLTSCLKWPVIGADLTAAPAKSKRFVAIGNNALRLSLQEPDMPLLVHPKSVVSALAELASGTVVMAGAVINPGCKIGRGVTINTSSSVDHDCIIAEGAHVAPGAHLGGGVEVGRNSWIGIGASVRHGIKIGAGCMIGAGAAVVKDVPDGATVVGTPARTR